MKKVKNGEIIIYAMALMLVTAGYFNYMTFEKKEAKETYLEDIEQETKSEEIANVGDAVLVSNSEVNRNNENNVNNEKSENKDENKEENKSENTQKESKENLITDDISNYYASSKLEREKMYAEMIKNYEEILNNANVSEVQKSIATQEIVKINNNKNAIMIIENLLKTKGFNNSLILINEKNIEVVVNKDGGLDEACVAQIQNIVTRELQAEIQNIHITEK